jgi:hypothetical protein
MGDIRGSTSFVRATRFRQSSKLRILKKKPRSATKAVPDANPQLAPTLRCLPDDERAVAITRNLDLPAKRMGANHRDQGETGLCGAAGRKWCHPESCCFTNPGLA